MTTNELRARVMRTSLLATVGLAGPALWVGGVPAGVGVLVGGALTVANFWWLARGASAAARLPAGRGRTLASVAAGAARFGVLLVAFAVLLASGSVHPVALVVGLSVLPLTLVTAGLRAAREGASIDA